MTKSRRSQPGESRFQVLFPSCDFGWLGCFREHSQLSLRTHETPTLRANHRNRVNSVGNLSGCRACGIVVKSGQGPLDVLTSTVDSAGLDEFLPIDLMSQGYLVSVQKPLVTATSAALVGALPNSWDSNPSVHRDSESGRQWEVHLSWDIFGRWRSHWSDCVWECFLLGKSNSTGPDLA